MCSIYYLTEHLNFSCNLCMVKNFCLPKKNRTAELLSPSSHNLRLDCLFLPSILTCTKFGSLWYFKRYFDSQAHAYILDISETRGDKQAKRAKQVVDQAWFDNLTRFKICSSLACLRDESISNELQSSQTLAHSGSFMLGEEIHGYLIKHGFFPSICVENHFWTCMAKVVNLILLFSFSE